MQIARCYGASYGAVRQANRLFNPNFIYPGWTISVPGVGSEGAVAGPPCVQLYSVQTGDTWQSLAQHFQTTAAILQRANPGNLAPGRFIYVPSTAPAATTPPTLSYNLLFLLAGDLAVWRSSDSRVELLRGNPDNEAIVEAIATNTTGQLALVRQSRHHAPNLEMALVNRQDRTVTVVEENVSAFPAETMNGENMLLSPDGQWGAYLVRQETGLRLTTFPTNNPAVRQTVSLSHGTAEGDVPQLFPGLDDAHFLLLDRAGVFLFDYALAEGEQQLYALSGEGTESPLGLQAVAWSPVDRYLLLQGGFFEGGAYFVLDGQTGALQQLPNSSFYVTAAAASWRPDGTVVVLTPPDAPTPTGPAVAVYRPVSSDTTLTLEPHSTQTLAPPAGTTIPATGPGYVIAAPDVQMASERLLFIIQGTNSAMDGLWAVDGDSSTMRRLNKIVPDTFLPVVWAPDGSGALLPAEGDVVYVAAGSSRPFSLGSWLGFGIADWHWVIR
jgi:hypothetical protein